MNSDIQLQLANFKLEVLQEIIHLLPGANDTDETLGFIMNRIFSLVEMEGASLILPNEDCDRLMFTMVRGEKESSLTGYEIDFGEGVAGKVFSSGKPFLVDDTQKDESFLEKVDQTTGYTTSNLIAVPIVSGDMVLGVLEGVNLDVEEIESPSELIELFSCIADLMAVVIENGSLIQKLDSEVSSTRRLLDISRAMNSALELSDVLDALMNAARNMIGVDASSLLLVEEEELRFFVAHGEKRRQLIERRIPITTGIGGHVARTGEPLIVNNVKEDDRFDSSVDKETGYETKNVLCVPMYYENRIFGVLQAINKLGNIPFYESDKHLLQTIANESTLAVRNSLLNHERDALFMGAVESLARAVDAKDEYESGHSERVAHYAVQIGKCLRPDDVALHELLNVVGMLHDVGKIGIPDTILLKSGNLSDPERAIIETHSQQSCEIIKPISAMEGALPAVMHHHENFDGTGYPDGLKGAEIPLASRIISIADAYDAITSDRPYRRRKTPQEAAQIIERNSGFQYDPRVIEAFNVAFENDFLKVITSGNEEE